MLSFWLGSAAVATAVTAGWHSMSPRSQLYGRTFIGAKPGSRLLALTYDDGPSAKWTPALLEVLARHDVRATFFMMGRHVEQQPAIARAVASAGHVVGNHTYAHPNLIFSSAAQLIAQLDDCDRTLTQVVGEHSDLFRPPFGGRLPDTLRTARVRGYVPVMWSVTAYDWKPYSPEKIEHTVARQIRGGDVILMHDGGHRSPDADRSATVAATDRLITRYKAEGYGFVTVKEMIETEEAHSSPATH